MTTSEGRSRKDSAARVPPHSLQAEESLLGAALLSAAAAGVLATQTRPEDFYKPAHGHIAASLTRAYEQGWPADPVTVAADLEREGHLAEVGGPAVLISLQAGCPSTTNAERYALIVHDHATLRRLGSAASRIGDLSYDGGDAHEAVEAAHALLTDVAANNGQREYSTLTTADVGAILDGTLEPDEPTILRRNDGQALFYAGKVHVLQAEPTSYKGWIALAVCVEILAMGGSVAYYDWEDTARGVVRRLIQLGADPAAVRDRFRHVKPEGPMGSAELTEVRALMAEVNPDVVVFDSMAEGMTADSLKENDPDDCILWISKLPRMCARLGACSIIIDHVIKDKETRGRWGRGSGSKLGAIDGVAYTVDVLIPGDRHKAGKGKMTIAKDRESGVGAQRETAAVFYVEPKANGEVVRLRFERDTGGISAGDGFKPTILMARCSEMVETAMAPLTASTLKNLIGGKPDIVTQAIARLLAEGFLVEYKMGRRMFLRSVKPYAGDGTNVAPPPAEPDPTLMDDPYEDGDF